MGLIGAVEELEFGGDVSGEGEGTLCESSGSVFFMVGIASGGDFSGDADPCSDD